MKNIPFERSNRGEQDGRCFENFRLRRGNGPVRTESGIPDSKKATCSPKSTYSKDLTELK